MSFNVGPPPFLCTEKARHGAPHGQLIFRLKVDRQYGTVLDVDG